MRRTITRSLIVALALVCGATTQAFAQGNPFDIDGTVTDAQNAYPAVPPQGATQASPVVDPNSNVKELGPINASATKIGVINTAPPPMLGTTNPNAQVDLNRVYATSAVSGANLWFYFGWVRDANSGSGFISIELDKSAPPQACAYGTATDAQLIAGCNPWSGRQDNDILILWDQQGGSTKISYRLYNAQLHAFGAVNDLAGIDASAKYSADGFRGEVAVNINAIVASQQNQCLTYANIIPGTVTGNSDSADYKDTVLSQFPLASNCGTVTVVKETRDGVGNLITGSASNGPFPYTLTAGTTPIFGSDNNGPQIDTDCTITATANICGGSLAQGGSSAIIGNLLSHSDYSLAEGTLDTKWSKTSITCGTTNVYPGGSSFTVPAGGGVTCTIVNTLVNGALTIIKHVENNNGGTATASQFTMLLNGVSKGGGAESPGNTYELPAGTQYTVDENMNSIVGYSKTLSTDCVGTIQPNVTKVCTIINDDIAPSLHLVKTVHNNFGGTATASAFSLTATGPTTISGNGDVQSTGTFSAGSYTLTEGTVNGYELETDWACSGPNGATQNGGSLTIGLAQAWTCTIVNKDKKASPTADTTPSTILHDTMTITGIRAGASNASSATVTFKLFSDSGCTVQVGSTEVRPVSSGAASTVNGVVVNTNGTYRWTAVYSGDNFNNPYTKQCGTEVVTVGISVTPNP